MLRAALLLGLALIVATSSPARAQDAAPERISFKATTDAEGDAVDLHLHVFKPEGWTAEDRRAAVVFFFGGGWSGGTHEAFFPQSRELSRRGMVAICAEYRVARRHGTPPQACVRDARSAMRYVRAHAAELGVDPGRIAAGGGSAGGHLAATTALAKGFDEPGEDTSVSCAPQLLLLYNPVIDTTAPDGWGAERLGEDAAALSPTDLVRADQPPTLIFHGIQDRTVPIAAVRRFRDAAKAAGAKCVLHETEGAGHGFFHPKDKANLASPENAVFLEQIDMAEIFLAAHGFLPKLPLHRTYLEPLARELRKTWPGNRTVNIVCHGHSVPAGYFKTPVVNRAESYPALMHAGLDERYPYAPVNVIVTAIGGENSEQGATRFEDDVLRLRPDLVTIDYSLNDRRLGLVRADRAWRSMIEAAREAGVPVILLTPTGDTRADLSNPEDPLQQHARQVRALAGEYGVGLVDSLAAIEEYVAAGGELEDLLSQVNHPNRRGHDLVAERLLRWFPR